MSVLKFIGSTSIMFNGKKEVKSRQNTFLAQCLHISVMQFAAR